MEKCWHWLSNKNPNYRLTTKFKLLNSNYKIQTTKFLMKYNLLSFQISGRLIIFITKHDYQVSTSFTNEEKCYKWLTTGKRISIQQLLPGLLLTVSQPEFFLILYGKCAYISRCLLISSLSLRIKCLSPVSPAHINCSP